MIRHSYEDEVNHLKDMMDVYDISNRGTLYSSTVSMRNKKRWMEASEHAHLKKSTKISILSERRIEMNHVETNLKFLIRSICGGVSSLGKGHPHAFKTTLSRICISQPFENKLSPNTLLSVEELSNSNNGIDNYHPEGLGRRALRFVRNTFEKEFINDSLMDKWKSKDLQITDIMSLGGDLSKKIQEIKELRWDRISVEDFKELATKNKLDSAGIQALIKDSTMPNSFHQLVLEGLNDLVYQKYGCYIVSLTLVQSKRVRSALCRLAKVRFVSLVNDPCASRVLQALVRVDSTFCGACLSKISMNWNLLTNSVPAIFLFSACLEMTPNNSAVFKSIGKTLLKKCIQSTDVMPKYLKRVLVSYLEYCEEKELIDFYSLLDFDNNFIKRMGDKYMVYIFSVLLSRLHTQSINTFRHQVTHHIVELLSTVHFSYIIDRLYKHPLISKKIPQHISDHILQSLDTMVMAYGDDINREPKILKNQFIHTLYNTLIYQEKQAQASNL